MTRKLLATFAFLLTMAYANAATIHVKPTMTLIPPGQSAAVITLTNQGDTPLNAQVRLFGWDQVRGEDALSPTNRLVASPPMLTLALVLAVSQGQVRCRWSRAATHTPRSSARFHSTHYASLYCRRPSCSCAKWTAMQP